MVLPTHPLARPTRSLVEFDRGGNQGNLPSPDPKLMDPEKSELIRLFGYNDLFGSDWLVRLAGAATALTIALIGYLIIWRVLSIGRSRSRTIGEFDQLIARLIRWLYIPLAVVFVIQQAGISLGNVWSLITAALALIALGLIAVWAIPGNCFSAFVILSSRFYKVGDQIEIGDGPPGEGLRGRCADIGLIYTTLEIEAPNNKGSILARIPNNSVFKKQVLIYRDGAEPEA